MISWLGRWWKWLTGKPRPTQHHTFFGTVPMEIESCTITADPASKLRGSWTIDGEWPVYAYPVAPELAWRQIYDDRNWPRTCNGDPLYHVPISSITPIEGTRVVWKDGLFDYVWGEGVLVNCPDGWYIDGQSGWASIKWSTSKGCWVTTWASAGKLPR